MLEALQASPKFLSHEQHAAAAPEAPLRVDKPSSDTARADAAPHERPQEADSLRRTTEPAAAQPPQQTSSLTTYRDHESGRLVVRVVDENSGDILIEFPPEHGKLSFPMQSPRDNVEALTSFEA